VAEVVLRRRSGLILGPADGLAEIEIEQFPMGRDILCTLKRARSDVNLRHYWACLHAFSRATEKAPARVLHELLKMECGLVTAVSTQSGGVKLVPDSIAFDKLSESDFIDFKRRAFDALRINFGVDPATLTREGALLLGTDSSSPGGSASPRDGKIAGAATRTTSTERA
jgi:hypothetical protein